MSLINGPALSLKQHPEDTMKRVKQRLILAIALSTQAPLAMATAQCYWRDSAAVLEYRRNVGNVYVPRDARIGTVIGGLDVHHFTPNLGAGQVICDDPTLTGTQLDFNGRATAPIFPGHLDPIGGEEVDGKIIQTNIKGVGIRVKFRAPLDGSTDNAFRPYGSPTIPFDAWYRKINATDQAFTLSNLSNLVTLVKTGPIDPGVHTLDGSELLSGHFSNIGKAMSYGVTGTIIQIQCTVSGNPVSADPVNLGEWSVSDFTGPGFTTTAIPFSITLSACEADPNGVVVPTAHIRLDGINGSVPIGPTTNGVFSLTSDSDAEGMGIQILRGDGLTPVELNAEVPIVAVTAGTTVMNFNARFYQTGATGTLRSGTARGALSFTVTYQ
ncbi:MAG TPA: fimbrial protein [Pseudomonas sp.]|jgi:type 1 fimbria pilin